MNESNAVASSVRDNVGQDVEIHDTKDPEAVFITSRARMRLALMQYKSGILARRGWINPLLLFLTVLSVSIVSDFGRKFGLSQSFWEAFFTIILVLSVIWLAHSLINAYRYRSKADLDSVIEKLESDD